LKVSYFHRRPEAKHVSVERVFSEVRQYLPPFVCPRVAVSTFPSRGFWPRVYNTLEAVFRQGNVNHITGDVQYLAILLRRRRTLLTILDCVCLERLSGVRWWLFFFLWYWLPAKRSAVISVISESTKKELLRYLKCDPHRIRVVYCPCRKEFHAAPKDFNAQCPVILQVGTGGNKNLLRVAEALQGIPCRLRIIGKLTEEQTRALQECRIDYSAVANISDEDVVQEFRQSDMVVFVSTYEGFGMPIIEANATGRPVVTSNLLSMPEIAGEAACLVDPFDVAGIREGILKVINDPAYREGLVRCGFENVKRFRPEKIAQEYVDIYRQLSDTTV
jgi:glycosyltransferase involved in cell wall biosynthesis